MFWRVAVRPEQTGTSYAGLEAPPSDGNVAHAGFHSLWGRSDFVAPLVAREIHFHSCLRGGDKSDGGADPLGLGEKGAISKNVAWGLLEHTIAIFWALCALAHTVRACSTCLCTIGASDVARYYIGHIAVSSCV